MPSSTSPGQVGLMIFGVTYVHILIILDSRVFKDHILKGIIAQTITYLPVTSGFFFFINSQLSSSKEIIMYEGAINQLLQHSAPSVILERGIHIRYRVWHRIV